MLESGQLKLIGKDHFFNIGIHVSGFFQWIDYEEKTIETTLNTPIRFTVGDGRKGHLDDGPYDVIHVGAAAEKLPTELIEQLKPNGRLVSCNRWIEVSALNKETFMTVFPSQICPVGREYDDQELLQIDKKPDGSTVTKSLMHVRYVALTDKDKQWPGRIS